ncbi:hypothetical protein BC828DRAFT_410003 [Blastocladiella britannica]|nr:hypothetical protein BC828DRAFT_410003 [Blastocladiella britannica]
MVSDFLLPRIDCEIAAGHQVVVTGDLNTRSSTMNRTFLCALLERGLLDVADTHGMGDTPTRTRAQTDVQGHRLDYMLATPDALARVAAFDVDSSTNTRLQLPGVRTLLPHISDHFALVAKTRWGDYLDKELAKRVKQAFADAGRVLLDLEAATPENYAAFADAAGQGLATSTAMAELDAGNMDTAWETFQQCYQQAIDAHLPTRRVDGKKVAGMGVLRLDKLVQANQAARKWRIKGRCKPAMPADVIELMRTNEFPDAHVLEDVAAAAVPNMAPNVFSQCKRIGKRIEAHLVQIQMAEDVIHHAADIMRRVEKRNDTFGSDVGRFITSVLQQSRVRSATDHVLLPDGTISHKPADVKEHIARGVQQWFDAGPPTDLAAMPLHWRRAFAPLGHVDARIWDGLMDPISAEELKRVLSLCAKDKAPGQSGLTLRLFSGAAFDSCEPFLLALANACLQHSRVPAAWRHGLIYLIPKTNDGFLGEVTNMWCNDCWMGTAVHGRI